MQVTTSEETTAVPSEDAAASWIPPDSIWLETCNRLRQEIGDGNFTAWFERSTAVSLEANTLVIKVANSFARDWIEGKYMDHLRATTSQVAGRPLDVIVVPDPAAPEDPEALSSVELTTPVYSPDPSDEVVALLPRFNFDSFVIGSSNRFAHAAALAVAEAPTETYNPLFIYGGAGLGKTHLLHAVGNYVRQFHPKLIVRYVSTEQFMNDFILSLQRRTIPDFHRRYRKTDVLLVDDVQFLEGKERTQEEFFHTFNALHGHSQMVLTSDRPPKKLSTLEERLRTRFAWGLITDIQPPDLETRLAILQRKSENEKLAMPPEVMSFIASKIQTNIRELEGALIRVAAYASLTRSDITLELAQNVLQSLLPDAGETRVTSDLVISVAADYFAMSPEEICSPSRSRPLVNARQVAMYLCRELTDLSLPKIGERFGGRDHSTVLHATRKVHDQMQESPSCYEQVRELTARIRQQTLRA